MQFKTKSSDYPFLKTDNQVAPVKIVNKNKI